MERVLVGLWAVALLLSSRGHGRTDYVFVCQLSGPTSHDGQLPNSRGLTVGASGNVLVSDALTQCIRPFTTSRSFLTSFGEQASDGGPDLESTSVGPTLSANSLVRDSLDALSRPLASAGTSFTALSSFGITGLQFHNPSGGHQILFEDLLFADVIDPSSELSLNDDPFLAKFGSLANPRVQPAAPSFVAISPPGDGFVADRISNHKLLLSLLVLVLGVLGTLGYAWRWRKRRFHRTLRGPRRTTRYRSPSLPTPRGPIH